MSFTVDDVLAARPSLLDRAKRAHRIREEQERLDAEREQADLIADTTLFLRDDLLMTEAELADVEFTAGPFNNARQQVLFKIEGMDFRAHYVNEKVATIDKSGEKVAIYDLKLNIACNPKDTRSWESITDLASLGKLLK